MDVPSIAANERIQSEVVRELATRGQMPGGIRSPRAAASRTLSGPRWPPGPLRSVASRTCNRRYVIRLQRLAPCIVPWYTRSLIACIRPSRRVLTVHCRRQPSRVNSLINSSRSEQVQPDLIDMRPGQ